MMWLHALQDAIGTIVPPYDLVNNPSPKVPPGLQPKIDLLLGWGKWACLILGVAGILICAGKMALGQSGRSHYAAEGASELPKVLLGVSLATVAVPIITAIFG
ncbi:hypothetical protein AB0B54_30430 [Microbispora bryophytorum]|nr:hypothetical protein [Microbispora camponoti]MBD3147129.1 hypothetical protein [Microbispora camponoti]